MSKADNCYTPQHIANFFLIRAKNQGLEITPMDLLKLVYVGYGWCLSLLGAKLFNEPIEAWGFGPVIPSIYHEFKDFGPKPINRLSINVIYDEYDNVPDITIPVVEDTDFIQVLEKVWETYKNKTPFQFSSITHEKNITWHEPCRKVKDLIKTLEDRLIIQRSTEEIDKLISIDQKQFI